MIKIILCVILGIVIGLGLAGICVFINAMRNASLIEEEYDEYNDY